MTKECKQKFTLRITQANKTELIVILYEMVLLCMDTALRSIKLTLLQLMTPIVLGAYIFKEDILGKWAKEIISTFLSLFLKVVHTTIVAL